MDRCANYAFSPNLGTVNNANNIVPNLALPTNSNYTTNLQEFYSLILPNNVKFIAPNPTPRILSGVLTETQQFPPILPRDVQNVVPDSPTNFFVTNPPTLHAKSSSVPLREKNCYHPILPKKNVSDPAPSVQLVQSDIQKNTSKKPAVLKKIQARKPAGKPCSVKIASGSLNLFGRGMHFDGYNYNCKDKKKTR